MTIILFPPVYLFIVWAGNSKMSFSSLNKEYNAPFFDADLHYSEQTVSFSTHLYFTHLYIKLYLDAIAN